MFKINTQAPNFTLPSTSNDKYSLKDSIGKYVVIYFYPKDDTPGCTIETNDFNKLLTKFKKLNWNEMKLQLVPISDAFIWFYSGTTDRMKTDGLAFICC